jgi:sugar phosphate isomerase/epimerase
MRLQFFCTRWGSDYIPFREFARQVKEAGYDGIEMVVPANGAGKDHVRHALQEFDLKLIAQIAQADDKDFEENLAQAPAMLHNAAFLHPVKINSQTGKDYFSFEQNLQFIRLYNDFEQQTGIPVVHELHRGRFNFAPFVTQPYFEEVDFHITADFSHWCCVTESLLQAPQWQPVMDQAIRHSHHIHARVGFAEGPQVSDPRIAEHAEALQAHLQWWRAVVQAQQQAGISVMTCTPEFGPAPYMTLHPHTQEPLASQWELNNWMMEKIKNL